MEASIFGHKWKNVWQIPSLLAPAGCTHMWVLPAEKESEAKSTQEISSGNSKKKRKRVKELPQLYLDNNEKIFAMLATRSTGNNVKKIIFFDDFTRTFYNDILKKVTGKGKRPEYDDRLVLKSRLLADEVYAKVKALAKRATERDV